LLRIARAGVLFFTVHLLITGLALIGGMWFVAEAVRSGATEIPKVGAALLELAQILGQPVRSLVASDFPKDSVWFWPILIANSAIWGCFLGVLWGVLLTKLRRNAA